MARIHTLAGINPVYVNQVFSSVNFSDEGEQEAAGLVANKGNQGANLVNILKPEALTNKTAINEISEATDIDPEALKQMADTKEAANETAAEEGMDKETAEALYFSAINKLMPEIISSSLGRYGVYAFFSDSEINEGTSDGNADSVEAIKVVKYVDDSAITEKGADEVADIIAEATGADKDLIQEVVALKEDAINETNFSNMQVFSEVVEELANQAGMESNAAVSSVLNELKTKAEEMENRIASGEQIIKTEVQTQDPSETPVTNTDKLAPGSLPETAASKIESDIKGSYTLAQPAQISQPPQGSVETLFSANAGKMANTFNGLAIQGAPETALIPQNYSANDTEANLVSSVLNFAATNIRSM